MNILPNFITESDESALVGKIELAMAKLSQKRRDTRNRIIRFGMDYETGTKRLADIPDWVVAPLNRDGSPMHPDDVAGIAINEYLASQCIGPHIDSDAFGDVAVLGLLSESQMRFTSPAGEVRDFVLPRRSLALMNGELRSHWKHETMPLEAERRISIVYRKRL